MKRPFPPARQLSAVALVLFAILAVLAPHVRLSAEEIPQAEPSAVGLSAEKLSEIRPAMQRYVDEGKLPGVVTLLARRGKIAHFEAVGYMDVEAKRPMRRDAIFRIYSMSKPITSVAVMTLYEAGKFELDDPVSKFIPQLKGLKVVGDLRDSSVPPVEPQREMTVRDLLRHTAGLTYGYFGNTVVDRQYRSVKLLDRTSSLEQMIDKLSKIPLLYQPGSRWHYSVAVDVLGRLVEVLSGERFDVYLQQHIFEPLDMRDTAFYVPEEKLDRFTTNYRPGRDGLVPIDEPESSTYRRSPSLLSGGGGLVSTTRDYLRFCQMLLNGGRLNGVQILRPETVALMTRNHLPEKLVPIGFGLVKRPGVGFGLGFSVRVEATGDEPPGAVGEYGWGGAASTLFWISPREEMIGIAMTQRMPVDTRYAQEFRRIAYEAILDPYDASSPKRKPMPATAGGR